MNRVRGLIFDNLGLKLVALLLAVVVYLNAYTDRPATMLISFPIHHVELADTLALSGPAPAAVQAELRGTGKQLIRLRVTEPPIKISLAGVGPGRYERALSAADLPLPEGVELAVDRIVSPRTLELNVEPRIRRELPVAVRVEGTPIGGVIWNGEVTVRPPTAQVSGAESKVAAMDSLHAQPVNLGGKRDTVRADVVLQPLPDWCVADPQQFEVIVPLEPLVVRRLMVTVDGPRGARGVEVAPSQVTMVIMAPRSALTSDLLDHLGARWNASLEMAAGDSRRVPLRVTGGLPPRVRVRLDPDSVTVRAVR